MRRESAGRCPLWHRTCFRELHKHAELAENGHARLRGFLPPVPLPRRMFAGARLSFPRPLRIGERARRVSTVAEVSVNKGAGGDLIFVRVRHGKRETKTDVALLFGYSSCGLKRAWRSAEKIVELSSRFVEQRHE